MPAEQAAPVAVTVATPPVDRRRYRRGDSLKTAAMYLGPTAMLIVGWLRFEGDRDERVSAVERQATVNAAEVERLKTDIVPRKEHDAHWDALSRELVSLKQVNEHQFDQIHADIRDLRQDLLRPGPQASAR